MKIKIVKNIDFNKPSFRRIHPIAKEGGKGTQKIWRFKNGFGASVVRFAIPKLLPNHPREEIGSYGINQPNKWELGLIVFDGDNWELCYEIKRYDDVKGYLTPKEVEIELLIIKNLSKLTKKFLKKMKVKKNKFEKKLKTLTKQLEKN